MITLDRALAERTLRALAVAAALVASGPAFADELNTQCFDQAGCYGPPEMHTEGWLLGVRAATSQAGQCLKVNAIGALEWAACLMTCPDGYEPVMRSNMRGGCAREVIDAK